MICREHEYFSTEVFWRVLYIRQRTRWRPCGAQHPSFGEFLDFQYPIKEGHMTWRAWTQLAGWSAGICRYQTERERRGPCLLANRQSGGLWQALQGLFYWLMTPASCCCIRSSKNNLKAGIVAKLPEAPAGHAFRTSREIAIDIIIQYRIPCNFQCKACCSPPRCLLAFSARSLASRHRL